MKKNYSDYKNNNKFPLKSFSKIHLLLILFFGLFANVVSAQTTLFQFNFESNTNPNIDNVVGVPAFTANGVTGTAYSTTTPCQGSRMYTAADWDNGDYYRFTVNTTGYANMTFSFCDRTNNTDIGTFLVRVSSNNGANWTTVLPAYTPTTLNNPRTTATFPTVSNDAALVWIEISKVSSGANNARTLLIDNATLTGYSIPTISSFTPNGGCSNTTPVVITGTNFTGVTGASGVTFGGVNAASYTVNSSTQITAIPAAGSTGVIRVVTPGGTATSGSSFTVSPVLSAPTVGTLTQPTCSTATGSVVLNGLPSSGSWALTRTPGNVVTTGTGASATISGLSSGSYTYSVATSNSGTGLKADYFNSIDFSGTPVLTRTDATVDFDWGEGSPHPSVNNDYFSVRWSGKVEPLYSQNYTFSTLTDDGVRLWVNGILLIDNWTIHSPETNTGSITLTAGVKYNIVLEYFENQIGAVSKLSWSSASQAAQIIPQTQLYPFASCDSGASANVILGLQQMWLLMHNQQYQHPQEILLSFFVQEQQWLT